MPASGPCAGVIRRVRGADAHDDAGIGVALVARILAHAVGDDAAGFARSPPPRVPPGHMQKL